MKVFAHRGASGLAPENTLAAIEIALSLPIAGVEIDVYPIEDEYIVIHDRWLTRTTGVRKRLDQISFLELRQLIAGDVNGVSQRIPTLSEVMGLSWGQKCLNIELKSLRDAEHFLNYLDTHLAKSQQLKTQQIHISAFNHHYLSNIRKRSSAYQLGWLTASNYLDFAKQAAQQGCRTINIDIDVICQEMVDDAHRHGLEVFTYTVDELDDIEMLRSMGVDGVFTNRPDRVAEYLQPSVT